MFYAYVFEEEKQLFCIFISSKTFKLIKVILRINLFGAEEE
jgi:hypothetical protein